MWRTSTSQKGRYIINAARKLATESAPPKQNVPPSIPQPPSKSMGVRTLKFIGLSLPVVAGGIVGYAWYDVDFRKQIEDSIPFARDLFENILPKDDKRNIIPSSGTKNQQSSVEKASKVNVQEEAAKNTAQQTVSQVAASNFDTYSIAQCSSERDGGNVQVENLTEENNKTHETNRDLYASYIQPSFGKANISQQTGRTVHRKEDNDTDEEDNEEDEEEDEEMEAGHRQSKPGNGIKLLSEDHSAKNVYNDFEDLEQKLTGEILANRSNPFHVLTVPDIVQTQKYQIFKVENFGDLLNEDDDGADDRASENGLTTALREKDNAFQRSEAQLQRRDDDKADNAALEVVIHKLATKSQNLVAEAVKAQAEVAACIRKQTKLLKQAMDDTDVHTKDAQWEAVAVASKERELAMMRASELLSESKKSVEKLRDVLQAGKANQVTQNNPAILPATKTHNELLKELGNANLQVRHAEVEANVMQRYKELVDKGKKQFQKEIESILPAAKFGTGKKLSEEELNALIAHAHRRIEQLQKQVAEQLALERQRLSVALEKQRKEDLKITNVALAEERQRLQNEFEAQKSKLDIEYSERVETEVRKHLARQAAAHSDHLRDVLAAQKEKLGVEFNRVVDLRLLEEREAFQAEVAGWISRLQGIEAAVEARAESEQLTRYAQDLWLACIALNSLIENNQSEDEKMVQPLRDRVDLILEAGNKHPFVETVAGAFPYIALDRGVSTESELQQRFYRVSRICRRLGLVNTPHSSLYKYLISFLHSFVVLDNVSITKESDEVDLTNLDNFALLSHAHYWMQKGNLDIALRFMVQLTGESRRAASDWIEETRLLLETKQIANTLMAYATATGLANTF